MLVCVKKSKSTRVVSLIVWLVVAAASGVAPESHGQETPAEKAPQNGKAADRKPANSQSASSRSKGERAGRASKKRDEQNADGVDDQLVKKVHGFVQDHQPKLMGLLKVLQRRSPDQHAAAVRELARSIERLKNLEQRDSELYAIELKLWLVRSELRQLVAKLAIEPEVSEEDVQKRLKPLLDRENKFEIRRLAIQKKRAEEQIKRLDAQIADRRSEDSQANQRSLKIWYGQVKRQQQRAKQAVRQRARELETKNAAPQSGVAK